MLHFYDLTVWAQHRLGNCFILLFNMKLKAVAFDMDGLMFNTEDVYWKAATELLGRRGIVYTQELDNAIMGRPPKTCFEFFKEKFGFPETWKELQTECEDLFLLLLNDGYATMPGLHELLEYLEQKNIPKCICTSSAPRIVSEVLRRKDMTVGPAGRFLFVLTAEDVANGKPDPEIYLKAAAKLDVQPSGMLVLEDSPAGCEAAGRAGAFGIAVRAHHNAHCEFPGAKKVVTILNDAQILDLF